MACNLHYNAHRVPSASKPSIKKYHTSSLLSVRPTKYPFTHLTDTAPRMFRVTCTALWTLVPSVFLPQVSPLGLFATQLQWTPWSFLIRGSPMGTRCRLWSLLNLNLRSLANPIGFRYWTATTPNVIRTPSLPTPTSPPSHRTCLHSAVLAASTTASHKKCSSTQLSCKPPTQNRTILHFPKS